MTTLTPTAESPLLRMTQATPTQFWNDSCAVAELESAVARGATGATCNPNIVLEVLKQERDHWLPRVRELARENPTWSEVDLGWTVVEEMAVRGAHVLEPVYVRTGGSAGRQSVQTDPAQHRNADRMVAQAIQFSALAPNIQVKFPVTPAGLHGIEEATAHGINITATVSFTVPQALAAAEAVERGLRRRAAAGGEQPAMGPVVVLMIGRLDDWVRVLVDRDGLALDPDAANWAGIAVFKRAYGLFRERRYHARLLAAAYRHRLHWTELVGGDVSMTIPFAWQQRFERSGIAPEPRIDVPVEPRLLDDLLQRVPDFRRAYEPDGLRPEEFESFGPTARTLRAFIKATHDLAGAMRDIVLPDPDLPVH